ncbi:MAG: phosphoribosylformylglycinamidine cyclo-ligase [Actinomycetes bacterium]|jgi:phosphoribosylformylglycinamidine cyclo-ligase|nr:phosphoribosylformylglycinamidine cyclo-ligase [Actinomycetes bacterium]
MTDTPITYAAAGVDTAEGAAAVDAIRAAVETTRRPEVIGGIGGFGGLFSIAAAADMVDPVLVSGTDGVGTKIEIARTLDRLDTIGIDLVAMCANDVLATGAEPLFFLDYLAIGKLDRTRAAAIVSGVADGCRQAGCALVGGEMAEHPGVMDPDAFDLSGCCVGLVDRPDIIDGATIQAGDVVLGLASTGLHSNGFSLVRRVLAERKLDLRADYKGLGELGALLLAPTRIYVRAVRMLLTDPGFDDQPVKGIAHITGGGITENLNRCLPSDVDALVDLSALTESAAFALPAAFAVDAGLDPTGADALATFNMGIGMALVTAAADADAAAAVLSAQGETVCRLGTITDGTGTVRYR